MTVSSAKKWVKVWCLLVCFMLVGPLLCGDTAGGGVTQGWVYSGGATVTLSFTNLQPSAITTSESTYYATLTATGANFNNVNQVTFSWSGPDSGSSTWNKGDSNWNAGVTVNSDTAMTLIFRVLYQESGSQSKTWNWTVTLKDSTGATKSRQFKVTYNPPSTPLSFTDLQPSTITTNQSTYTAAPQQLVNFTVDAVAPAVAIDVPAEGSNLATSTVWINGTFNDATSGVNTSTVIVRVDGTVPTFDSSEINATGGWYNYSLTLPDGRHKVTVDASDYAGNPAATAICNFTVDTQAPYFIVVTPHGNISVNTPWINATFADTGTGVNASATVLLVSGTDKTVNATVNTATYLAYEVDIALGDGPIPVNISISDYLGTTTWNNWTFVVDTVAPTVTIDVPAEGATFTTAAITVSGTATDTVAVTSVTVNGAPVAIAPGPTVPFSNPVTLAEGANTITVNAADSAGNLGSSKVNVTYSPSTGETDYPGAKWVAASSECYTLSNRPSSYSINYVVIHVAQGTYAGTISWFQNPDAKVSAHYVIRSSDGEITQMVRHKDIAWHAGNWDYNTRSIGIEHEGWVDQPSYFTDQMYRSSANLTRYICDLYGIPKDRNHIIGHNEVPGATHTDPGSYWDWNYYMQLVTGSTQLVAPVPLSPGEPINSSHTPIPYSPITFTWTKNNVGATYRLYVRDITGYPDDVGTWAGTLVWADGLDVGDNSSYVWSYAQPGRKYRWGVQAEKSGYEEAYDATKRLIFETVAPLSLQLSYKNTMNLGESTEIKAKVFKYSTPVTAKMELKINGNLVKTVESTECIYSFTPDKIGSYTLEVTAKYENLKTKKIGKVEVIGDISEFISLAENMKTIANEEIDQAVRIPASKSVDFVVGYGSDKISEVASLIISPLFKLAGGFVSETYLGNLDYFADRLGYLYQETISNNLEEDASLVAEWGFSTVEEYTVSLAKGVIEFLFEVNEERANIATDNSKFIDYIRQNDESFLTDVDNTKRLFLIYSEPMSWVVETHPLFSYTFNIPFVGSYTIDWTMIDIAKTYDFVKGLKDIIKFLLIVVMVIITIVTLIIAAKATVFSFGALFPIVAKAVLEIILFIKKIVVLEHAVLLVVSILLVFSVHFVVPQITEQHGESIDAIEDAIDGMSFSSLSIQTNDTILLSTTSVKSPGHHSIIVTPDGKIVRIIKEEGYYIPRTVGEYKVYAFTHTPKELFYKVSSTSFNVSKPNITLDISKDVNGMNATITTFVHNYEDVSIGNLTLILSIENSTGGLVYADANIFDLNQAEGKNFDFSVTFDEIDVYTASASLTIMSLFPLQEEKFPIVLENATAEDVAITKVEYKDIYSPFENVTMNVTLQAFSDMEFELNISEFNYSSILRTSGMENVTIILPRLPPEEYTMVITAIKDERILDSSIITFTVEAIDIAILTFNTTKIFYNAGEEVAINLNLMNLSIEPVDAEVNVRVLYPNGSSQIFGTVKSGDNYNFIFIPAINGTYILDGIVEKEGYRIKSETIAIIIGEMSMLNMNVIVSDIVVVSVWANGIPAKCNVTIFYDNESVSKYTSDGKAVFNKSDSFIITADKMFYELAYFEYVKSIEGIIFDTGASANPYPSLTGQHNGTITPYSDIVNITTMYTYACHGTGGHTEYVKIWNSTDWNVTATWDGYIGDWYNLTFNNSFTLYANETYNYTIRTGSYPQIIHLQSHNATGGVITCTGFVDVNGKRHEDWIPAIRLSRE